MVANVADGRAMKLDIRAAMEAASSLIATAVKHAAGDALMQVWAIAV